MNKKILIIVLGLILIAVTLFLVVILPNINKNQVQNTNNNTTAPSVKSETLKQGTGSVVAKNGDTLTVNFITTLSSGQKVDSSYDRKSLTTFKLGNGEIMKGWDQGLAGMKVGEIRRLTIPPDLAYGSEGNKSLNIPKDATLISTIELIGLQNPN